MNEWLDLLHTHPNGKRLLRELLIFAKKSSPLANVRQAPSVKSWTQQVVPGNADYATKLDGLLLAGRNELWTYNKNKPLEITSEGRTRLEVLDKNIKVLKQQEAKIRDEELVVANLLKNLPRELYSKYREFLSSKVLRTVDELNELPKAITSNAFMEIDLEVGGVLAGRGRIRRAKPSTHNVIVYPCPACGLPMCIYDDGHGPVICNHCAQPRLSVGSNFCISTCPPLTRKPYYRPGIACMSIFCRNYGRVYPLQVTSLQKCGIFGKQLESVRQWRMLIPGVHRYILLPGQLEKLLHRLLTREVGWSVAPLNPVLDDGGHDPVDILALSPSGKLYGIDSKRLDAPKKSELKKYIQTLNERRESIIELGMKWFPTYDSTKGVTLLVASSQVSEDSDICIDATRVIHVLELFDLLKDARDTLSTTMEA